MNNLYYMIWADAIISFKKHHPTISEWKSKLLIYITFMQALNAWILFLWLKYFDVFQLPLININIFPVDMLNNFIDFSVEYALPFGILNYFLIFYKSKYKKITEKYSILKHKYALTYSFVMILGAYFSAILYGILT